jgi:hypothetical protein
MKTSVCGNMRVIYEKDYKDYKVCLQPDSLAD